MDTSRARELFQKYGAAVAYVEVESTTGERGLGSAFHVGEGVFVTARHVVDGRRIVAVGTTETAYIPLVGTEAEQARTFLHSTEHPVHIVRNEQLEIEVGPFFHKDPLVDIAVFRVANIDARTPVLPLGDHLDDWLGESDFVLSEAIVLGYPPIPFARRAHLVGARAEVNAMIDRYDVPHVYFILSATPRGGFSGGVAISEWGQVIGLITQSVYAQSQTLELGYMAVITVEPIYICLADYKLLPKAQSESWNGLWNSTELDFLAPGADVSSRVRYVVATVELFDDGHDFYVTITCKDVTIFERVCHSVAEVIRDFSARIENIRPGMRRFHLPSGIGTALARERARRAAQAAVSELLSAAYVPTTREGVEDYFLNPDKQHQ